ncbi:MULTISPECIES: class I SAM-dependent methyltransferase [unclassified Pseudodesulfovibrio]|uniref:class I SAM-dependent methyltransferase n=1 Tax=unclassified Pseudodesulfovibrio TaxID=2661612 RepID=UPI000FEBDCF7|nr:MULTISPECIES: class I SAM-dependent methyltransferase [unclassified Pseudodesulfovibrio]MCJ2163528.1 class I SAM-dependent methyltransferase [Pseudodesulfovibrio sp. S3-i]RWU06764.1 class I SAM-dependent methyltransferase [Pseudodesulfovibrio sp. S3]
MSNTPTTTRHGRHAKTKGHGPTSLWLHEPKTIVAQLDLCRDIVLLDAGCGAGEYSLLAARQLRGAGRVIAIDNIAISIEKLLSTAEEEGLTNIQGHVCDITDSLPVASLSVDLILLSTVLHIRAVRDRASGMFREFRRVLRPEGKVAVIECKKEEANFGPPLHSRLSPNEVEALAAPSGLRKSSLVFFEHTYLLSLE